MPFFATEFSLYKCPFGALPMEILLRPPDSVKGLQLPATVVEDSSIGVNVLPFITCSSLANPITALLTAAALGVLTPGPCIPLFTPWSPGAITIMTNAQIQLTMSSRATCNFGQGPIEIFLVPAMTIMTPI